MVKKTEGRGRKGVLVNRGTWTAEEDKKLVDYVKAHGEKKWRTLPAKAGLSRCGKSCRLRWLNYLRPGIKRGNFSEDEEDLIIRLHNLLGNRWSLIAGRLPGRTDNEIKNYWNTHLSKRSLTICELNLKLNCPPKNNSICIPSSSPSVTPKMNPDFSNARSIFNFEPSFGCSGNSNELMGVVEDYDGISWDNYLNVFSSEFSGWDDEGFSDCINNKSLDFDQLINFLEL